MKRALLPFLLTICSLSGLATLTGCSRSRNEGVAIADAALPPTLSRVTPSRTDLLFRYRGKDGFETATKLGDVPEDLRAQVQVVDLSLTPEQRAAARYVQIFDLRKPAADGSYPGRYVLRQDLENTLAQEQLRAPQRAVTMYSASWCGVCAKARQFLTDEGVAFIEKDVEKDPKAAAELQRKAKAAGVPVGGVPVFDVDGRLLSGFDASKLLAAIRG